MSSLDITTIAAYLAILLGVGIAIGLRQSASDYFVLSRRAGFFLIVASVVSSWVGVGMFVGTTASSYDTGLSLGFTGACGAIVAVVAAGLAAPRLKRFGDRYNAHTIGDFFRVRYSPLAASVAAGVVLLVYLLLAAVQFTGLAALLRVWTGAGLTIALLITAVTTVLYTMIAGIKSDFYTDGVHFVVMVAVLFGLVLPRLWNGLGDSSLDSLLPQSYFDPFAFGGVSYFIGGLIVGVGIVFVSMDIWQRIYASATERLARWALVASAFIIAPFYGLAVLLGMAARGTGVHAEESTLVLFEAMKATLPPGLLGLGIAAFIALFMSSANTMLMVVSATITKDFVLPRMPSAHPDNGPSMIRVGRLSTLAAGAAAIGLSYLINDIVLLSVVAVFALLVLLPAIAAGFFWRRATALAATWSVGSGAIAYALALPMFGANAFVPAFALSTTVMIVGSILTSHSSSEPSVDIASSART